MIAKTLAFIFVAASFAAGAEAAPASSALSILKEYAADYAEDPTLTEPVVFGVRIGDDFYTVDAAPHGKAGVRKGAPKTPTFYFTIESEDYLEKLERGDFTALTLMGKAIETDVTPMDFAMMEGFEPPADFSATLLPLIFHFWTKGQPEIVRTAPEATRFVHGANLGVLYYQPGLRSAWFDIRPGQHVNEDPESRANPFPSLFIMVRGEATARIGGVDRPFREGEAMLVPAGVSHEFLNEGDQPAFGFLFMFGDGA